jgi:hypothetical protein
VSRDDVSRWGMLALVLVGAILAASVSAAAPPDSTFRRQTAIHAEGIGSGEVYSINLDRRVTRGTALRAGFGTFGLSSGVYALPLSVSALIGEENLVLELSGGPMFVLGADTSDFGSNVIITTMAGIRYEPRAGGMFLRGGIGPLYGGGNWEFWPTFALGLTF